MEKERLGKLSKMISDNGIKPQTIWEVLSEISSEEKLVSTGTAVTKNTPDEVLNDGR